MPPGSGVVRSANVFSAHAAGRWIAAIGIGRRAGHGVVLDRLRHEGARAAVEGVEDAELSRAREAGHCLNLGLGQLEAAAAPLVLVMGS